MNGTQSRWGVSTVADVARLDMGQSPDGQATNTEGKGIPLIGGAADYKEGRIKASRYTTQATKVCRKGDLILCIRATIGKVAVAGTNRIALGEVSLDFDHPKSRRTFSGTS